MRRKSTQRFRKEKAPLSHRDKTLEELKGALHNLSVSTIIVHCNERYVAITGQEKDTFYHNITGENYRVRDTIRYFDSYWSHQLEQYRWYLMGYIPREVYHYWLICRRRDWNIGDIVSKVLIEERQRLGISDQNKLEEMDKEREAANTEQKLYQDGWERAKRFLPDQEFVVAMGNVMLEKSDHYITTMLETNRKL